jgi:hypothetical protein
MDIGRYALCGREHLVESGDIHMVASSLGKKVKRNNATVRFAARAAESR